jgi:hypothetical protein
MPLLTKSITGNNLSKPWKITELNTVEEVFNEMTILQSENWVSRGQATYYGEQLFPPIDRGNFSSLARAKKIQLEQQSLYLMRSSIKYFSEGERETLYLNLPILMLMQHNGVPTRLLDWSMSPFVSLYFACRKYLNENDKDEIWKDGEIWAFAYDQYEITASEQWKFPETQIETERGRIFDQEMPAIFSAAQPENLWFVLKFLQGEFSRISSQHGLFSVVSWFGIDHAGAIKELLGDDKYIKRFKIKKGLKREIRKILLKDYGIWEGSMFPDSTGVSEAIARDIFGLKNYWINGEIPEIQD